MYSSKNISFTLPESTTVPSLLTLSLRKLVEQQLSGNSLLNEQATYLSRIGGYEITHDNITVNLEIEHYLRILLKERYTTPLPIKHLYNKSRPFTIVSDRQLRETLKKFDILIEKSLCAALYKTQGTNIMNIWQTLDSISDKQEKLNQKLAHFYLPAIQPSMIPKPLSLMGHHPFGLNMSLPSAWIMTIKMFILSMCTLLLPVLLLINPVPNMAQDIIYTFKNLANNLMSNSLYTNAIDSFLNLLMKTIIQSHYKILVLFYILLIIDIFFIIFPTDNQLVAERELRAQYYRTHYSPVAILNKKKQELFRNLTNIFNILEQQFRHTPLNKKMYQIQTNHEKTVALTQQWYEAIKEKAN